MNRGTRIHIAIGVSSMDESTKFYSNLFGSPPTRTAIDQNDWILDDPQINFSIFLNTNRPLGIEHFGFDAPVTKHAQYLARAGFVDGVITDPDGVRVELFASEQSEESEGSEGSEGSEKSGL